MIAKQTNHGKAANNTATATARAATAKPCRRTDASATGRAGDVPAADNRRKAQTMKKTTAKRRKAPADDFWTPELEATWKAVTKKREAEKAAFYANAELQAVTQGIDPADKKAVRAFLKKAMRRYSTACRGDDAPPDARDLLPNTDWRIQHARADGNELAAAMLYNEAAAEVEAYNQIAANEAEPTPKRRGRPRNPNGRTNYLPTEAKRLAAIAIVERLRSGKADTQTHAAAYFTTHNCDGYAGADFGAFQDIDGSALRRWATFNGTTVTALRTAQAVEWEEIKKSLK